MRRYYFVNTASRGDDMTDNKTRYTLRIEPELLEKLGYIAEYDGRTKNGELIWMIRQLVANFEKEHGEIKL